MKNQFFKQDVPDLTKEQALIEAKRCLNCKKPFCKQGCPINNDIPEFIKAVLDDNMQLAYTLLENKTNLPAICGKICPHEKQCQGSCILNRKNAPVKIGQIENYIANYAYENNLIDLTKKSNNLGSIAIIGSGPAGISCAYILAKEGFNVDIYDTEKEAGGVLAYGIPGYRLSDTAIKRELEKLVDLDVKFILNTTFGVDFSISDLKAKNYDAIFISTGSNMPKPMKIAGENLDGVIHANEFLKNFAKSLYGEIHENEIGIFEDDSVLVIGGGNVAMDSSRSAKKITQDVKIVYRRTKEEMPASMAEYDEVIKDDIPFMWRHSPVEFLGENGKIVGLKAKNLDTEQEVIIPCTKILTAIGANPKINDESIRLNEWGYIDINDKPFGMTNIDGVFSAGDVVHGSETVVLAMREGRKTAYSIKEYINNKKH